MDVLLPVKLVIDMFRDIILTLSEFFFWLLGGFPIMNTLWFIPYVILLSLILIMPFYMAITIGRNKSTSIPAIVFLVSFLPVLLIGMGPPIVQMQMMQECETVQSLVETDRVKPVTIDIRQCRIKENYYDDFKDWKILGDNK